MGKSPAAVGAGPTVDLASSLATSTGVLSGSGAVLASSATLDGAVPRPPLGALRAARPGHPNTVTWQPRAGVRQAAVIVAFTGPQGSGTVVVSRSLRLVERRENLLLQLAALGWLAALGAAAVVALAVARSWPQSGGVARPRRRSDQL